MDLSKLSFLSTNNYLKRSPFCGTAPVTAAPFAVADVLIVHNINYVPFYEVFAEVDNDGIIWNGGKVHEGTLSVSAGPKDSPGIVHRVNTTELRAGVLNDTTDGLSKTCQMYWLIYLDYKV